MADTLNRVSKRQWLRNYSQNVAVIQPPCLGLCHLASKRPGFRCLLKDRAFCSMLNLWDSVLCWFTATGLLSCRWRHETTNFSGELSLEELVEPHLVQWKYFWPHFAGELLFCAASLGMGASERGKRKSYSFCVAIRVQTSQTLLNGSGQQATQIVKISLPLSPFKCFLFWRFHGCYKC